MKKALIRFSILLGFISLLTLKGLAQSKVAISISNPGAVHVCINSDYLEIEVRNITTSTVTGVSAEVDLPSNVSYIVGSLNTSGASEQSTSNLNKPVFSLPDIGVATAVLLKIRILADCGISNFLNGGGLATTVVNATYSGGTASKTSVPVSVKQPSLSISAITNQLATADRGTVVVRQITIKNSGSGRLTEVVLMRSLESGVVFVGSKSNYTLNAGGDTAWTTLDSNQFDNPYIGNGDNYLDLNETITVTDTILVVGCSNFKVNYQTYWGCAGEKCKTYSASTNVSLTSIAPNLLFTPTSSTGNCLDPGYQHQQEIIVYNAGNDTARAIDLDVFQSANTGYYGFEFSKILENSFTYQFGRNGTSTSISPYKTNATTHTGNYACLGNGAKGRVWLNLPDLAPGDSIIVIWQTEACCPSTCGIGFYTQRWKFLSTYYDQCSKSISSGELWGSLGMYMAMTFTSLTPTDISDGETKTFEFNVTNGSLLNPISTSLFSIELVLPEGINHSLDASDLQFAHPNGGTWSPDYIYQSNDTVFAGFQGAPGITLVRSDLLIKLGGDCSNSSSNDDLNYEINIFYNPDTTCTAACRIPVYCRSDVIRLHCQTSCNAGLHFNGFEAKRISYGEPDNNNDGIADASGTLDLDKIKTRRIMYGDTLLTVFRAKVHAAGSITQWFFGKATSTMDYGYYLSVADVRIKIYRAGNLLFNCNNILSSSWSSGYQKTFVFDISYNNLVNSGCSLYSSFAYLSVDSIELEVSYVVDKNLGNGIRDLTILNDFYLSSVANPNAYQKFQCDSFSARLNLLGSYYTNYGRGIYPNAGCSDISISQNFYLSVGNCCTNYAGGNLFPYEYRAWAKLDKILLYVPSGFDYISSRMYQYRTAGTSLTAYDYVSSLSPDTILNGIAVFDVGSLYEDQGGSVKISDDGFYGIFLPVLRANCLAPDGQSDVRYDFVFENLTNVGPSFDTIPSGGNTDVIDYSRPDISLTPQSTYVYAQSDTVDWDVRISNSSSVADANYVWLGAFGNNNIQIVEVQNLNTGIVVDQHEDVFELGPLGKSKQGDFRVRAVYSDCEVDSIELLLGYDCSQYPDSLIQYPCEIIKTKLYYEPVNTRLEADMKDSIMPVDLCADTEFEILVRNTGNPKVFDLYLDILIRPGMIINDTAWLYIKGIQDSSMVTGPQIINGNTIRWYLAEQDSILQNEGLQGANQSWGSEIYLKVKMSTNCDFVSGSYFLLKPGGNLNCGKPVNAAFDIGDPIDIKGVTRPYYSAISFEMNHLDVCNYEDDTRIKFINLGPDSTGNTDQIVLSFPRGLYADTGYISNMHNAPTQGPAYSVVNGENVFEWIIPPGIAPGDSSVFDIQTLFNNEELDCGIKQVFVQAVVSQPVLCVKDSSYCNIRVATSSALHSDSVEKSVYELTFLNAKSIPDGVYEDVSLSYRVENMGSDKANGELLKIQIVYDANGNNKVDSGDLYITSDSIFSAILTDSSQTNLFNFRIASDLTCDLLLYISDSSCVCNAVTELIPAIQLQNAGNDTLICPGIEIEIGQEGNPINSYSWNNEELLKTPDSSISIFKGVNFSSKTDTVFMVLTTDKGACSSRDTVNILLYPGMSMNMADTVKVCIGSSVLIGEPVIGGMGVSKQYTWTPIDSLDRPDKARTYANPILSTTYYVQVQDASNCLLNDSIHVKVVPGPIADFIQTDSCAGTRFVFENTSTYPESASDSIHWTIGNLDENTFSKPELNIDSAQTLMVRLFVENQESCWDTVSKKLEVFPLPEPEILAHDDCQDDTTLLIDVGTIKSGNYAGIWKIGTDSVSGDSMVYEAKNTGTLLFEFTAVSDHLCTRRLIDSINIYMKPEIKLADSEQCFNDSMLLNFDLLNMSKDSIQTYAWDAGDGTKGVYPTLGHLYTDTGKYDISIIAGTGFGCMDTSSALHVVYPNPIAEFNARDICLGDTTYLIDLSELSGRSLSLRSWNIDGNWILEDSIHKLVRSAEGSYSYGLKIENDKGCKDSVYQSAKVFYVQKPEMLYSGNCSNESFLIETGGSLDSITRLYWIIGPDTFNTNSFNYKFATAGNHIVKQVLETNRACVSDSSFVISVNPVPIADFEFIVPCDDKTVIFNGSGESLTWNLGDGQTSNLDSFSHEFSIAGTYTVSLIVSNSFGCEDSIEKDVSTGQEIQLEVLIDDVCESDSQWVFHRMEGNTIPISSAIYTMGNGDIINSLDSFSYTYSTAGSYAVSLTVRTNPFCIYEAEQNLIVHPIPEAGFFLDPEDADIFNSTIIGRDLSNGADSIAYLISDGALYVSRDFEHEFKDSGVYYVRQHAISTFGCMDSATRELYITFLYKLFIPNAFSPNADGYNDVFRPIGMGLKNYEMQIYNRWGQMVFSTDSGEAWDGAEAIHGYYAYVIKAYDFQGEPHFYKGVVYLVL